MAKQDNMQPEANEQTESSEREAQASGQEHAAAEQLTELSADDALAKMEEELTLARDAVLRAQADAQNVMRRAEQDVEKARKFALERFCAELLPVVDNLERALEATSGDDEIVKPIAEGVQLTLKSFQDALKKFHIEAVDPAGEPFDPQLHQAMFQAPLPGTKGGDIIQVAAEGFMLHDRLLRPAQVGVSSTPAS